MLILSRQLQCHKSQSKDYVNSSNSPIVKGECTHRFLHLSTLPVQEMQEVFSLTKFEQIEGKKCAIFMKRSKVAKNTLKKIWLMCSSDNSTLERDEFYLALRLISYAQNNIEICADSVLKNLSSPLPKFFLEEKKIIPKQSPKKEQSLPTGYQNLTPSKTVQKSQQSQIRTPWLLTPQKIEKFTNYFKQADKNNNGKVTSQEGKMYFMRSQLPKQVLFMIWTLTDVGDKGYLNVNQFIVAIHLLSIAKMGFEIPNKLPNHLQSFILQKETPKPSLQPKIVKKVEQKQKEQIKKQESINLLSPLKQKKQIEQQMPQIMMQKMYNPALLLSPPRQIRQNPFEAKLKEKEEEFDNVQKTNKTFLDSLHLHFKKGLSQIQEENMYLEQEVTDIELKKQKVIEQILQLKYELEQETLRTQKLQNAYLEEMKDFNEEIIQISMNPDNILIAAKKISQKEKQKIEDMTTLHEFQLNESNNAIIKRKQSLLQMSHEIIKQPKVVENVELKVNQQKRRLSGRYEFLNTDLASSMEKLDIKGQNIKQVFKKKKNNVIEEESKDGSGQKVESNENIEKENQPKNNLDELQFSNNSKNEFGNSTNEEFGSPNERESSFNNAIGGEWVDFSVKY